jgi:ribonuclease J
MMQSQEELVFVALGGLGEIGMNCALYGFGTKTRRKWILIDLGLSFAGPELPGIDLVMPDLRFVESIRRDLLGLILTHAHEDHVGAIADLWPRLGCPVYGSRFTKGLLQTRRLSEPGAHEIEITEVRAGDRITLGPFGVEFVNVAHSIPESMALAITTPAGTVIHSGDWKIDPTPMVGEPTDWQRLQALGDAGVLALICDSTNVLREGESPSERDVAASLKDLIATAPHRVAVTTFASNVARIRAVGEAALATGRKVVVVGRALERVIDVAGECGYLEGLPDFLPQDAFRDTARSKLVALVTGSQGEPRAALARIATSDHPDVTLSPGDRVIFSSRTIPGNERPVGAIINGLIGQGVEVVTDRTHLVHVSGHPRRAELVKMYRWTRPKIAIPAHGELLHLSEHAAFARAQGVPQALVARNGDLVQIGGDGAAVIDETVHGRLLKDGDFLVPSADEQIEQRRRLAFAGVVSVALAIGGKGHVAGDPDVMYAGLPAKDRSGRPMDDIIDKAIFATIDGLPRAKLRDPDTLANALERAIRSAVGAAWGKKPLVHVLVVEV